MLLSLLRDINYLLNTLNWFNMEYNKKINNTSKSKLPTTKNNNKCTTIHTRKQ